MFFSPYVCGKETQIGRMNEEEEVQKRWNIIPTGLSPRPTNLCSSPCRHTGRTRIQMEYFNGSVVLYRRQAVLPSKRIFVFVFFIKITICQAACFLLYKIGLMGLCTGFSFLSGFEVFYHCFFGCVDAGSASKKGGRGGDKVGDFPQKNKGKNPSSNQNFTGSP